ncbi:MAG: KamA family radical SAM protein [Armatimonadota bacterium]|nr:KamA family radical SAM protein [Armatimonadota bacterium]
MLEKRSAHTQNLVEISEAVSRQFVPCEREYISSRVGTADPLLEEQCEPVRGLVHKYHNRVLCLLTAQCASYCRFCTRRRMVSDIEKGRMAHEDIDRWVEYLAERPEVTEVILSGGDPFVAPIELFTYALKTLSELPSIKVIRVGTRVVVSAPELLTEDKLDILRGVRQPLYIGINFEHPDELTEATIEAVGKLRKAGAILYSQTVFLKNVNDDYDTLYALFTRLVEIGVRPYYIYRCDPVAGIDHFRVDFKKERAIMTRLRRNLSGLAYPTYVIDTPFGNGKVPVPLGFWDVDDFKYRDFQGEEHEVI